MGLTWHVWTWHSQRLSGAVRKKLETNHFTTQSDQLCFLYSLRIKGVSKRYFKACLTYVLYAFWVYEQKPCSVFAIRMLPNSPLLHQFHAWPLPPYWPFWFWPVFLSSILETAARVTTIATIVSATGITSPVREMLVHGSRPGAPSRFWPVATTFSRVHGSCSIHGRLVMASSGDLSPVSTHTGTCPLWLRDTAGCCCRH